MLPINRDRVPDRRRSRLTVGAALNFSTRPLVVGWSAVAVRDLRSPGVRDHQPRLCAAPAISIQKNVQSRSAPWDPRSNLNIASTGAQSAGCRTHADLLELKTLDWRLGVSTGQAHLSHPP